MEFLARVHHVFPTAKRALLISQGDSTVREPLLQAAAVTSHSGLASAINNAFSQTAGLLAIAVLGVLMFATFDANLDDRLAALDLPPEARQQLEEEKVKLGAAEAPEGLDATLGAAVDRAIDEAFVSGYRVVMLVAAVMALASAFSAALLVEDKKPEEDARGAGVEEEAGPASGVWWRAPTGR